MFDYQDLFHCGTIVADIDAAMSELGTALGLSWARVQSAPDRAVWTPELGAHSAALTFVYSCERPQHIELLCGGPGSIWDPAGRSGIHHLGVWSHDVAADADRHVAAGWRVTAAAAAPADGYGTFAYVESSTGVIVELVSSAAKPRFDEWFAGGSLGSDRDPA